MYKSHHVTVLPTNLAHQSPMRRSPQPQTPRGLLKSSMAIVTEVVGLLLLLLIRLHWMHPLRQLKRIETNALGQQLLLRPLEVP